MVHRPGFGFGLRASCAAVCLLLSCSAWSASGPDAALAADIDRFEVQGNTLLGAEALARVLGPTPARLAMGDIQKLAQTLQQAYRDAGYGAVVVRLPPQSLQQRVLRLDVTEGRLSQVQLAGNKAFSREHLLRTLPALRAGQTPNLAHLDSQLLMVNENPARSVRVVFQPGEKRADVEALVVVEERPITRWQGTLDNTGTPSTGEFRFSLGYQNANLADSDAVLAARLSLSPTDPSRVLVLGGTLRVPLYGPRLFLEGSLLASNTRDAANATPAGDLRFSGKGQALGLRVMRVMPSLQEVKSNLSAGLEARQYRRDCTVGGLGSAACGTAAAPVDVLPLTLSLGMQKIGRWSADLRWSVNVPAGAAGDDAAFAASRPGADSRYQLLRLSASRQTLLGSKWSLAGRLEGQWTADGLVSAEQFGLGGASSVRGYRERELGGDTGLSASLELTTALSNVFPVPNRGGREPLLSAFVDVGAIRNRLGTQCLTGTTQCTLWGAGIGVAYWWSEKTVLQLEAARAGRAASSTLTGDWRAHLSLNHTL